MSRFIQSIKCKLGLHVWKLRQSVLRDRYAAPELYCICCYKEGKKL